MKYLIAKNEEEYVSKALEISSNLDKYLGLRKEIFNNTGNSPLFNNQNFSKNFYNSIEKIVNL